MKFAVNILILGAPGGIRTLKNLRSERSSCTRFAFVTGALIVGQSTRSRTWAARFQASNATVTLYSELCGAEDGDQTRLELIDSQFVSSEIDLGINCLEPAARSNALSSGVNWCGVRESNP